jgi:methyl-accepting chemotaxis protein
MPTLLLAGWLMVAVSAVKAAPDSKVDAKRFNPAEVTQGFASLQEAQRGLAASIGELRGQIDELRSTVGSMHEDLKQARDLVQTSIDHNKEMREEVRGLYVESSGLKGDIAQTGKAVEALQQELGSFRLSSGIIIALVIVLQLLLISLTFRGRGGL